MSKPWQTGTYNSTEKPEGKGEGGTEEGATEADAEGGRKQEVSAEPPPREMIERQESQEENESGADTEEEE